MAVATSFHENLHMAAEQKSTSLCCCGMIGRARQLGMHQWSLFWSSGRGALAWDVSGLCAFGATARYMSMIWSAGPQTVVFGWCFDFLYVLPGCASNSLAEHAVASLRAHWQHVPTPSWVLELRKFGKCRERNCSTLQTWWKLKAMQVPMNIWNRSTSIDFVCFFNGPKMRVWALILAALPPPATKLNERHAIYGISHQGNPLFKRMVWERILRRTLPDLGIAGTSGFSSISIDSRWLGTWESSNHKAIQSLPKGCHFAIRIRLCWR